MTWARGNRSTHDLEGSIAGLRGMGADEATIEQARKQLGPAPEPARVRVFAENWHAAIVFLAMGTQWHWLPAEGGLRPAGMRYEALPIVLQEHEQIEHRRPLAELMPQLRTLERAALLEFH